MSLHWPAPTAAFSRADTRRPGYLSAARWAADRGFTPVLRPAGGHLVAYHSGCLVVDVLGRHPDPRRQVERRFALFAAALAAGFATLGVPARVGPVPREYCPGRFSVTAGGPAVITSAGTLKPGRMWTNARAIFLPTT